jgi:hypothetical protein
VFLLVAVVVVAQETQELPTLAVAVLVLVDRGTELFWLRRKLGRLQR